MTIASRMMNLGTETAFEVLAKARALEAQGKEIIHLEIGEPDFDTPPHIVADGVEMSTMVMPACASATKTSDPAIATLDALPGVSKVAAFTGMAGFEAS